VQWAAAHWEPQRGPGKLSRGAPKHFHEASLGRKFLNFFSKLYILAISGRRRGPQTSRGPGYFTPPPHPLDGPGGQFTDDTRSGDNFQIFSCFFCQINTSWSGRWSATAVVITTTILPLHLLILIHLQVKVSTLLQRLQRALDRPCCALLSNCNDAPLQPLTD